MANLPSFLTAYKSKKGAAITVSIDWSQQVGNVAGQVLLDLGTQAYNEQNDKSDGALIYPRGAWIDNSANTNDIILSIPSVNQQVRIYAGSIVLLPLITMALPQIYIINTNNGTANVGLSTVILTSWPLEPDTVVPPSSQPIIVKDSTLAALIAAASAPATLPSALLVATRPSIGVSGTLQGFQVVLPAATQVTLFNANTFSDWFVISNVGSSGPACVRFASSAPVMTQMTGFLLAINSYITSGQLGVIPPQACYAYSTAGTTVYVQGV
jgi:hypothetical protein